MFIRQEKQSDHDAVFEVVRAAFENAEYSDHDEHNLVNRLRKSEAFIPELSLVAEVEGKIVGQILFTKLKAGNTTQLALAPVSVAPSFQGKGIGGKLIEEGHRIAKNLGYEFSILMGHAEYYPRFRYKRASEFGIKAPFDVPDENSMAINLMDKDTKLNCVVEYAKEFHV